MGQAEETPEGKAWSWAGGTMPHAKGQWMRGGRGTEGGAECRGAASRAAGHRAAQQRGWAVPTRPDKWGEARTLGRTRRLLAVENTGWGVGLGTGSEWV